ncbi:MAG: hypothetical protein EOM80_11185, partial [Erysipelotrichia bacterium]|nr:hypothetical protein [Erysipelotrichia bacterium]
MGRASFLTPVYFFTSTRSASGKASIVANLATHLNNLGEKIAIVDLDSGTPLKLKSSFSQAITLQEYSDISTLPHTQDSRYQKNFYFSDTTLISYFPAFNLTSSIHLFNDAVLRDFFIQLKSSFDVVMVNFPSGTQYSQQVSELLSRNYLWRGNRPLSLILSQPDEKSIILLDTLIKENPALYYQLNENTALVFNRVPATPEDQSLAERTLNNLEIRKLFNYPFIFVSPINDEFSSHRLQESPAVLKTNSLLHQTISGFQRFLSFMNSSPDLETTEKTSEYQPCLDGELLEKLSPHLEKIQIAAAARLFVTPDELQVFLEESPGNYRIRIRMSGITNTISGIPREIAVAPDYPRIFRASPGQFGFANTDNTATSASIMDREKPSCLSVKPVFRFDDRFAKDTDFNIAQTIVMQPEKSSYPSPILFKSSADLPDIPSLGHILGFATQKNRHFDFICDWQLFKIPGVTHFFIPPEFAFKFRNYCPLFHNHAITVETVNRDIFNHNARYHLSPLTRQFESQAPAEPVLLNSISGSKLELSPEHDFLPRFKFARLKDLPVENRPPKRFSHQTYKINICQSPLETRTENFYTNLGLYGKSTLALHIQNTCKKIDDSNFTLFSTKSDPYTPALFLLKASTDAKLLWKPATRDESFCLTKEKVNSRFIQHDFAEFIKKELDFNIAAFNCIRNYEDPVFNIENVSSKNENYHQPATPVLPAKFASEILLLEHGLNALLKDMPIKSGYFYQARTRLGYTPQHPLFFKLGFSYPAFSPIQNSFVADRTNIAQIFHLTDFAFSSIQHVLKSDSSFLCRDILPIYSNLKKEPEYKDFPSTRIYRTDFLLDAEMETRALKPVKNQMHLIRPAISEFPQPASKSRTRKLR